MPQNGGWADIQIYYYRYYLSGDPNGFVHGLKYIVNPNTYAIMTADGLDPLGVTDAVLAQYADQYPQYDSERRVTLETLASSQTVPRSAAFRLTIPNARP